MATRTSSKAKGKSTARRSASRRKRVASRAAPEEQPRVVLEIKGAAGEKGSEFHLSIGNRTKDVDKKEEKQKQK